MFGFWEGKEMWHRNGVALLKIKPIPVSPKIVVTKYY